MHQFDLKYTTLRNITPKDFDTAIYRGICPATHLLGVPTDKNVRDAIEASTKLRREIRDSIADDPTGFVVKNGGITMLASAIDVKDAARQATLHSPSIINGAQTQAVIEWWAEKFGATEPVPYVQFEVLVIDNQDLEREVSVARNSMHKVNVTSIVGFQGGFDELVKPFPDGTFAWRETDTTGEDPVKLLQVAELLDDTWERPWSTYTAKHRVLSRYAEADPAQRKRINKLAPTAWELYQHFRVHEGFESCGLHASAGGVYRDKSGGFQHAADALVFPIIYAHRERLKGGKVQRLPEALEIKLVRNAATYFTKNASSDVATMGRTRGAYDDLRGRLEWLEA